jgi:hypothetical protein
MELSPSAANQRQETLGIAGAASSALIYHFIASAILYYLLNLVIYEAKTPSIFIFQ